MREYFGRRSFLRTTSMATIGLGLTGIGGCCRSGSGFKLSLAQWSLHRALFEGKLDPLDFAPLARSEFGITAVEYVNQFYKDNLGKPGYLQELKKRADDSGVKSLLIMVDGEGELGARDEEDRQRVVENHYKWVEAAEHLGCHSIRVNAGGPGARHELAPAVVDGLGRLSEFAAPAGLNVIVENHGGFSSDGAWLAGVIAQVGLGNCGTLPDFGNFCIRREKDQSGNRVCVEEYDRYQGVAELMPFAKAVSAKAHDFDDQGNEIHTDYFRMMGIVLDAGYTGYVGIEYEGRTDDEYTGILKTKALLEKVRAGCAS
jgi:hydroxypyruvate isomerase